MWERQKCQGADRRKTRHERKRRSENEGGGGGPYEGESLMEMDLTKVEIRWGNCEKMADVLTGGAALEEAAGTGAPKSISGCLMCGAKRKIYDN